MKLIEYALKPLLTIAVALLLGALLILPTGTSPVEAYRALAFGAFGNLQNLANTLTRATPLLFTGLAAALAFQAGIFNIGAEGQMYLGALTAALVGIYAGGLPAPVVQPLAFIAAAVAGGIWSLPASLFRARLQINEVITTIMLNNIALLLTGYLATYPFKGELPIGATAQVPQPARLLHFTERSDLNLGFVVALGVVIALYYFLYHTGYGFEYRALGANPTFAGYMGVRVPAEIVKGMFLSGMIAGLGGAEQVLGVHLRFISGFSPGYAFTGITVALLGRLHPFGVLVGAIFFGALDNGALRMETLTNVSRDLLTALQGIIILLLAAEYLLKFRFAARGRLSDPA